MSNEFERAKVKKIFKNNSDIQIFIIFALLIAKKEDSSNIEIFEN